MLVVDDVHVRFGDVVAVDGVSLDLAPGEILGLVGDSGAARPRSRASSSAWRSRIAGG